MQLTCIVQWFYRVAIPQIHVQYILETVPCFFSFPPIVSEKRGSDNIFHMSGPVKTPSFNLASESCRNLEHKYLKQSPSLGSDLINCFISPNFMWRGVNKTLSGGTKVVFMTFLSLGVKAPWSGQSVLVQWKSGSTIPQAYEAGIVCITCLLAQQH